MVLLLIMIVLSVTFRMLPLMQPWRCSSCRFKCFSWCRCHYFALASIGDDSIVGAGAVVHRNVPSRQVVVGIPARPLRGLFMTDLKLISVTRQIPCVML